MHVILRILPPPWSCLGHCGGCPRPEEDRSKKKSDYGEHLTIIDIDGLLQERRNSSALAMELRLSCTNPSICSSFIDMERLSLWQPNHQGNHWRLANWQPPMLPVMIRLSLWQPLSFESVVFFPVTQRVMTRPNSTFYRFEDLSHKQN